MQLDLYFYLAERSNGFLPSLTLIYRDGWEWWASVELGRRLLLILLTVTQHRHMVCYSIMFHKM